MTTAYGHDDESSTRNELEDELAEIVYIVQCWGQVAAFASDWYKLTLVELGALEFTLDVLY